MKEENPRVVIIAGANGAGKSTSSRRLLTGPFRVREFVNADVIAQGLSAFEPEKVAISAGRIMLSRLRELAAEQESFAFETTLASRSFARWIKELRKSSYDFYLFYFWVPSPDFAIRRVALRVQEGGHHVLPATVQRRYIAGIRNFFDLYRSLTSGWRWYNSSLVGRPKLIASGKGDGHERIHDKETWGEILRQRAAASEGDAID